MLSQQQIEAINQVKEESKKLLYYGEVAGGTVMETYYDIIESDYDRIESDIEKKIEEYLEHLKRGK